MRAYIPGGVGILEMGTVPARVTKVVVHVDGLAPITAQTVPAPGVDSLGQYFVAVPTKDADYPHVVIDEYEADGRKVNTWDSHGS